LLHDLAEFRVRHAGDCADNDCLVHSDFEITSLPASTRTAPEIVGAGWQQMTGRLSAAAGWHQVDGFLHKNYFRSFVVGKPRSRSGHSGEANAAGWVAQAVPSVADNRRCKLSAVDSASSSEASAVSSR